MSLQELKNTVAGHAKITNKMAKECHYNYNSEILHLFHQSIETGSFPSSSKYGYVTLILKQQKPRESD